MCNYVLFLRTLYARRERAVNTLQLLLAPRTGVMDAIKTLWERRVDAVGTLWWRCVHATTDKIDIFRRTLRRPDRALKDFQNAVQTLWHRRLVWQWLNHITFFSNSVHTTYPQRSDDVLTASAQCPWRSNGAQEAVAARSRRTLNAHTTHIQHSHGAHCVSVIFLWLYSSNTSLRL